MLLFKLVEDKGVEPLIYPCHGYVIPLHQSPVKVVLPKSPKTPKQPSFLHVPDLRNFGWCSHQESNLERLLTMEVLYHLTMGAS
tara:strand:- start:149 stop:400 length:252 start_codon:yes stop_codon:yes gene_type:complete